MKILIVSEDWYGSLGYFCTKALEQLGHDVQIFRYRTEFWKRMRVGKIPVLRTIEQRMLLEALGRKLVETAVQFQPDLVFVLKGELLLPRALEKIKDRCGAVLINWNPDSPFNPINSTRALIASIPFYDIHFTWGKLLISQLINAGAKKAEYLPFAYDPDLHRKMNITEQERNQLGSDVCFVGTWDQSREELLGHLAGCDLSIWGNSWENLRLDSPLRKYWRGKAVYGEDMCKIYSASKINLNLLRSQNENAHNMRTFEGPATGAFFLATRSFEQLAFFIENHECAYFNSPDELKQQIDFYLENDSLRNGVAQQGYQRILQGQHTYEDRMKHLLMLLNCDLL